MDVLRLIECVKKHVYLYNISHKMYKNVGLKTWAWESIAEELNQTSEAVRLKWKTIRDGYIKYKKQLKNAAALGSFTKVPDYIWCHHLKFLDTHQMSQKNSKAFSKAARKTYTTVEPQPSSAPIDVFVSSLQAIPTSSTSSFLLVEPLQQGANAQTPAKRSIESNEPKTKKIKKALNHDAIDYLFLSYAQTFKKFPVRQQALMKMELARMFSKAELAGLEASDFESVNSFSYVQSGMGTELIDNVGSPTSSNPSSSYSNSEQKLSQDSNIYPIKEEQEENTFPEEFQEHIVP